MLRWKPRASHFLIAGAVVLIAGELLHPERPSDPTALLATIAGSGHWGVTDFVQAIGEVLVVLGLIDRNMSSGGGSNSRLRTFAIAGVTLAVAALTLDGDAFKGIADAWASAPRAEEPALLSVFVSDLHVQSAVIDAATILLFGFTPLLAGLSLARRPRGKLPGRLGIAIGAIAIVIGSAAFLHAPLPARPWYPAIALAVGAWAFWVGVATWRDQPSSGHDGGGHAWHEAVHFSGAHGAARVRTTARITEL